MLDFLVCSLLLFVIGTGGKQTRFATSAPAAPAMAVHEEFSPAAIETMQQQWNRDYEQQSLLARLSTQTTENEQLRGTVQSLSSRLEETSATLAEREQEARQLKTLTAQREESIRTLNESLQSLSQEKGKVEQQKRQIEQTLNSTESQLALASEERSRLQQEKVNLEKRAEQLGQTIASQQATIQTLSEGVRVSQVKMETQFADFAREQQQMTTTLGRLDEFARTLPSTIQYNVADVKEQQRALQENIAALDEGLHDLQADLQNNEQTNLLQAIAGVAKGQQDLQSQLAGLLNAQGSGQITQGLNAIQSGQDALRQQTARLAEQVEAIQARKPGPFQAVKNARLELRASVVKRNDYDSTTSRFSNAAYPPVFKVGDRFFIVAGYQRLGIAWAQAIDPTMSEVTELKYTVGRRGEALSSMLLLGSACALRDDPRVVAIELKSLMPGLSAMQLAGSNDLFHSDQARLHVFKSTEAGLSFEIDAAPDLSASSYLVVKRPLRGVASWFENPAYRPDVGDYVVTPDGKLVGIMVSREKCFVLGKDNILACALSISLSDKRQFPQVAKQFQKLK
jgi:predicted  nucleic acid-binding Zn-ribbon protein